MINDIDERIMGLEEMLREFLPQMLEIAAADGAMVILHQDAFAADYQYEEYALLGMAIKYLGLRGKDVHIIGTNRETL